MHSFNHFTGRCQRDWLTIKSVRKPHGFTWLTQLLLQLVIVIGQPRVKP